MKLATEYAVTARVFAQRFDDPRERAATMAKMRNLPRIEDAEAGFLKARAGSFLKALVLNSEQVPAQKVEDFKRLLIDTANFIAMLPDTAAGPVGRREVRQQQRQQPQSAAPATRVPQRSGYARPVPERDD